MTGVTEMILQSHTGIVHLLLALLSAIPNGSVQGLVAHGNFVVDIARNEGALTSANIASRNGGKLQLRYANCSATTVTGEVYIGAISTLADTTY